jgi:hypothetical protein
MSEADELSFKISLLGPTQVGKTSIVATMLQGGEQLLVGTPVTMRAYDAPTERRIALTRQALNGGLKAGEFHPGSLQSTQEPQHYNLLLDPGVPGAGVQFNLLDFPGGWLNPVTRPTGREAEWQECKSFIRESSVLIVPVDASVLMEASRTEYKRAWPSILTTEEIRQVAGEWASARRLVDHEPALLIFCPVKCESYFDDNGGRIDRSGELFGRFGEEYGPIVKWVRDEYPGAVQIYCPVDTIGCVELFHAKWTPTDPEKGGWQFEATFGLRPSVLGRPAQLQPKGADDVLTALCSQLMQARFTVDQIDAVEADRSHEEALELAERNEGIIRNMLLYLRRERQRRRMLAFDTGRRAQEMRNRVEALDKIVRDIADRPAGPRVRAL